MSKRYLGKSTVPWSRTRLDIYAEARIGTDDMNDQERTVETIEHEQVRYGDVPFIAITWTYGTPVEIRNGNGGGGAGIDAEVVAGMDDPTIARRLLAIADRWHLNTMRAGCAHQQVVMERGPYGRERPSLDRTPPCPITGYRYGHAWLVEIPPDDVLAELHRIFSSEQVEA